MTDQLHPPVIRIGPIAEVDSVKAARKALTLALHYGDALVAVDEFGVCWAMWSHGRHGRRVVREARHYVVDVFVPRDMGLNRRCKWFIETVSKAIYEAARKSLDWQRVVANEMARELAA